MCANIYELSLRYVQPGCAKQERVILRVHRKVIEDTADHSEILSGSFLKQ